MIDPNIAGFDQLVEFGFNRFQSNNIIEYRGKGGVFSQKTDLLKIYGIDSALFKIVESHISLDIKEDIINEKNNNVLINVELNNADTTELLQLEGIGSVYANRIIKYRNLLGGFYSVSQLLEVYNLPEETFKSLEPIISVDTLLIQKIRINFVEYTELLRHPYINKKQVEAVLYFRNQKGSYLNVDQLKSEGLLDSETFRKIKPYLTCR
jgi:DNA uptake protein ComE-like DNA-binding protein